MKAPCTFVVPVRTRSALNLREHWATRHRRVAAERRATALCCPRELPRLPVVVELVRVSPGTLDDDNLRGALKGVRDELARRYGVDDRDARVDWRYDQRRGPRGRFAVEVTVTAQPECWPDCDDVTCRAHWVRR